MSTSFQTVSREVFTFGCADHELPLMVQKAINMAFYYVETMLVASFDFVHETTEGFEPEDRFD